ncbi:MAG: gliding motility-associated ABC transporter ATP-binding subunit GldA [Flavobacteriales bacterium]|nr:gliding motility-associated ABC transporter ATP-binding subunit GldA [Flavobacteriales bacterium]
MSIEVKNISKIYGQQKALDDVTFNVGSKEIVGFLGPNGAGKSTMMKILTGYLAPNSGSAMVAGFDVMSDPLEVKRRIGYLPEHNPLYLEMYVREYLGFIAKVHRIKSLNSKVEEVLSTVGLTLEADKKIGALSKGYRQRVGLAQAIIHDPEVIILDEPTTGLDPNQIIEIRALIKTLGQQKTVMMSTHIMQEVEAICDRVIIIDQGKIVKIDKTKEIQREKGQKSTFIAEFDRPIDLSVFLKLEGLENVEQVNGNIYKFITNGLDIRNDIFKTAVQENISVLTLKQEEQSLEDVFKSVTKNQKK